MEFKYPKVSTRFIYLQIALGLITTVFIFWNSPLDEHPVFDILFNTIFSILYLFFITVSIIKYYKRVCNDVVRVNDKEISLERKGERISIPWNEVEIVNWGNQADHVNYVITVKGKNEKINIGNHLIGLQRLIPFIKLQVGERFITWDVPWKLKDPQNLNYKD